MQHPAILNIKLYRGQTDRITFRVKDKITGVPINLSDATVSGYIRVGSVVYNFTLDDLSQSVPAEGKISIVLHPSYKEDWLGKSGRWAVKIVWSNGDVQRIIEGKVTIVPEQ